MGQVEVWKKPLASHEVALAVFNRGNATAKVSFDWSDFGLSKPVKVRNLWERRDVPSAENLDAELKPRGVVLLRLRTK
jgi:alpha-galactosidase